MDSTSEQALSVGSESVFKSHAFAFRQIMERRISKRILIATLLAVACIAAVVMVSLAVSSYPKDDIQESSDSTTIVYTNSATLDVTGKVSISTTGFSTSSISVSTSKTPVPFATSEGSQALMTSETTAWSPSQSTTVKATMSTAETATTSKTRTMALPSTAVPQLPSVISTSASPIWSSPSKMVSLTSGSTSSDTKPTPKRASPKVTWESFLKSELNTRCDCESCSQNSNKTFAKLSEMELSVDSPSESVSLYSDWDDPDNVSCAIIKSMLSALSLPTPVPKYVDCKYDKALLTGYYAQFPGLELPDEETWDLDSKIFSGLMKCRNLVAIKQCKELPRETFFGKCQ